jgi:hypothetical protein
VPVGKVVGVISLAVIKIWDSRHDDLLGSHAFANEDITVSLARHAKGTVGMAEAGCRCANQPARKKSVSFDKAKQESLSIYNPLLNQHDPVVSNILLQVHVRTGHDEVIRPMLPLVVDRKVVLLKIRSAPFHQFVAQNRELHQPESSQYLMKTVAVVG